MRILLAEDDSNILAIAKLALERVGGHQVTVACNGVETLERAESEKPELILLDVMMPEMNGFEACAKLKENAATAHIPVIFLTARAQAHEVQHGMSIGAIGYILKPFDPMTLHKQIEEVLSHHVAA